MKLSILIIEDDQFMLDLTSKALKDNYYIFSAKTVDEAKKILKKNVIHLLLTDIHLENENTFDLINEIRNSDEYNQIPIVVYTGKYTLDDKSKLLENGIAGFIEKPFSLDELQIRIQRCIELFFKIEKNKVENNYIEFKEESRYQKLSTKVRGFILSLFVY